MTEAPLTPDSVEEAPLPVVVPASPQAVAWISTQGSDLNAKIVALTIEDDAGLERAADLLADVKSLRAEVAKDLGEPAAVAHTLWKMIRARFSKHDDPLAAAETVLKTKVGDYHRALRATRDREIAAAEAQARQRKIDDEARQTEALALEDAGDHEAAQQVLDEKPEPPPPRSVAPTKTKGMSVRETWKAEITDIRKVIAAAAAGDTVALGILSHKNVVKVAESIASATAKSMMANMDVPGVRAYPKDNVAAGKRR